MFRAVRRRISFIWEYAKANIAMEMEYRTAFIARLFGVVLNDAMWLTFWLLYFTRFPVVRDWGKQDIVTLWAVCALGYGIGHGLFGNAMNLAKTIASGNLDFYLAYPKNALLHILVSKVQTVALGDVLFGPLVYFAFGRPTLTQAFLFILSGFLTGAIFVGFSVVGGSLAFFVGNSEGISAQLANSLIHFSTYPSAIFHGVIKIILFTVVPAAFINSIPVRMIRNFDGVFFVGLVAASIFINILGCVIFKSGLRRYESGNLIQARM